jgi:hypothetical protein
MTFTPESDFNAFAYFGSHHDQYEPDTVLLIESLLSATIRYDLRTDAYYMQRLCRYYLGSDYSINLLITYVQSDMDLFSPDSLSVFTVTDSLGTTDLVPNFDSFMRLIGRDATFVCMYAALQNFRANGILDFESMYSKPLSQAILARRENIHESLETLVTLTFEEQFVLKCIPIHQELDDTRTIMVVGLSLFQWAIRTPKSYLYVGRHCFDVISSLDDYDKTLVLLYLLNLVHYYAPRQMTERDRAALEFRLQDIYSRYTKVPWDLKELHEVPDEAIIDADLESLTDSDVSQCLSGITLNSDVSKLDFIRVLYVLYELDFFVKESGKKVTKKELFAFLATWLGKETLAHYDKDMTNSWKSDMSAHIAIFDTMRSKMVELATNKNVANYKKIE